MADSNRTLILTYRTDAGNTVTPSSLRPISQVRTTNEGLQWNKTVNPSTEIQPDRNVTDMVDIGAQGAGTLAFELHPPHPCSDTRVFLESLMCASFDQREASFAGAVVTCVDGSMTMTNSPVSPTAGDVIAIFGVSEDLDGPWYTADATTYTRPSGYGQTMPSGTIKATAPSGSTCLDVFSVMQLTIKSGKIDVNVNATMVLYLTGFSNPVNNGFYKISPDGTIIYGPPGYVDSGTGEKVHGGLGIGITNGTEENYAAISVTNLGGSAMFQKLYMANRVAQTQFSFDASSIVTGTHTFMGKSQGGTWPSGPQIQLFDRSMSARANVAVLNLNGSSLEGMSSAKTLTLTVNNNLRAQPGIGSYNLVGIGAGTFTVTGSMSAYFQNGALYNHFLNGDNISLNWVVGIDGAALMFDLPKCRMTSAQNSAKGLNQDLTDDINFQAIRGDDGYTMGLTYFPYAGPV